MIQLRINGSLINFGHIPTEDIKITEIEITAPPAYFVVQIEIGSKNG